MNIRNWFFGAGMMLLLLPRLLAVAPAEKLHNEKVSVVEHTLAPGDIFSPPGDVAGVVVYLDAGSIEKSTRGSNSQPATVKRGDAVFRAPKEWTIKNSGASELRLVWVAYLGQGSAETWGTAGLAPHYKLLFENNHGRVYDIQIPAGTSEPRHSHHDRVVICLSGAELMHELSDGRKEVSTLKTGEIAWRLGGTHVGHNLGKTDLWVIAIEPK